MSGKQPSPSLHAWPNADLYYPDMPYSTPRKPADPPDPARNTRALDIGAMLNPAPIEQQQQQRHTVHDPATEAPLHSPPYFQPPPPIKEPSRPFLNGQAGATQSVATEAVLSWDTRRTSDATPHVNGSPTDKQPPKRLPHRKRKEKTNDANALKWQPVETPLDHGSTERLHPYTYDPVQSPTTSSSIAMTIATNTTNTTVPQRQQHHPYPPQFPHTTPHFQHEFINASAHQQPPYSDPYAYTTQLTRPAAPAPTYAYHINGSSSSSTTSSSSSTYMYYNYQPDTPPYSTHKSRKRSFPIDMLLDQPPAGTGLYTSDSPTRHAYDPPTPLDTVPQMMPPPPQPKPVKSAKKGRPPKKALEVRDEKGVENSPPPVAGASVMLPGSSTPEPGLTKKGKKRGRPPKSETGESAAKRRDTKNAAGAATATGAKKGIKRTKEEVRLYCTCKQPFVSPRYMLPCEGCQEWYHGECVGLDRTRGEWLDLYYCAKCTSDGQTSTYKPACANDACEHPARISKTQGRESKYCSPECGLAVARGKLSTLGSQTLEAVMHTTCAKSQLNLQVDRDDQARLQAMRRERDAIRDRVAVVERRKAFLSVVMERLSDVDTKKECRFDSRLVCPSQTWRVVRSASLDESAEGGVRLDFSVDDKEAIPASLTKYTICPKLGKCLRHEGWQQLKALEIEQDRTMEIAALARLNRERQHIKARMRLRRQNASAKSQAFMENGTIVHNAS